MYACVSTRSCAQIVLPVKKLKHLSQKLYFQVTFSLASPSCIRKVPIHSMRGYLLLGLAGEMPKYSAPASGFSFAINCEK